MHPKKQHILNIIKDEPKTLDDLGYSIIKFLNTYPISNRWGDKIYTGKNVVGFKWEVTYNEHVSNSHDCPLNGVTNWGNTNKDIPTSYPGFYGRASIRYRKELDIWGSEPLREILTYPGTGGGGGGGTPWEKISSIYWNNFRNNKTALNKRFTKPSIYSWDYKFFIDDWPLIQKYVEHQQTLQLLQSKKFQLHHTFEWQDEDAVKHDLQLIDYINTLKMEKVA